MNGPKMEPCGVPLDNTRQSLLLPDTFTLCILPVKYLLTNLHALCHPDHMPSALCTTGTHVFNFDPGMIHTNTTIMSYRPWHYKLFPRSGSHGESLFLNKPNFALVVKISIDGITTQAWHIQLHSTPVCTLFCDNHPVTWARTEMLFRWCGV